MAGANRQQKLTVWLWTSLPISADTGQELGEAFRADLTLTSDYRRLALTSSQKSDPRPSRSPSVGLELQLRPLGRAIDVVMLRAQAPTPEGGQP